MSVYVWMCVHVHIPFPATGSYYHVYCEWKCISEVLGTPISNKYKLKLSISLQLPHLGQSAGILGRVISSSQGLCPYMNAEKRTHNTNTKHLWPMWDSNPRSERPSRQRQLMT
jgi:hypothetical protein